MDDHRDALRTGSAVSEPGTLAPRRTDLEGVTLGIQVLGSPASGRFLDLVAGRLEERHFLAGVVRAAAQGDGHRSSATGGTAEPSDAVVIGVAEDDPSATAALVQASSLERSAVPCVVLLSESVVPAAEAAAAALGAAGIPLVAVAVDVGTADEAALRQAAVATTRDVERGLCTDPGYSGQLVTTDGSPDEGRGVSCAC